MELFELARIVRRGKEIFATLQAGRGVAALMVVLFHAEDILSRGKYWNYSFRLFAFGHSGVEFFFVLSGVVILLAHADEIGRTGFLGLYMRKRFRRIYPIYWLVLACTVPAFGLVSSFGKGPERNGWVIFESFLLVHIRDTSTVISVAWTLYHEVLFYVVFAALFIRRSLGLIALGLWFALSAGTLFTAAHGDLAGEYFSHLNVLFGFGMLVALVVRRGLARSATAYALSVGGSFGFALCCIREDLVSSSHFLDVAYGFCAAICIAGLMLLERAGRLHVPRIMQRLGDASYSIYLVHFLVMSALAKGLFRVWVRHPTTLAVPFSILVLLSAGFGYVVHLAIEVPLLKSFAMRAEGHGPTRSSTSDRQLEVKS